MLLDLALVFLIAYLIGSIPFGLILTRMAGLGDIRAIGSGNIGATNVMRTGKKWLGLLVFLLDAGKGAVAVGWGYFYIFEAPDFSNFSDDHIIIFFTSYLLHFLALAVTFGHIFPLWLRFRGGKGVATVFGILFILPITDYMTFFVVICAVITWLIVFFISSMSSLSSLTAVWICIPAALWARTDMILDCPYIPLALLITWTHRENIKRIMAGTEHKFGRKK